MQHWSRSLLNLPTPEFMMGNFGEPLADGPSHPSSHRSNTPPPELPWGQPAGAEPAEANAQQQDEAMPDDVAQPDAEAKLSGAESPDDDVPADHALPAAYMMWKDLARCMRDRALQWEEQEFRYRKERAAILYEIQQEQIQKALLESALEEFHRQEELLELERILRRHQLRGG